MPRQTVPAKEFEIGRYFCPTTKLPTRLRAPQRLAEIKWPYTVKRCPTCGEEHVLRACEVQFPPSLGAA